MTSAMSVKDRLKKKARDCSKSTQEILTSYGLERTIYRLSVSEYLERFTLKGGILLYALFSGDYLRATGDIDLLAKNLPNKTEEIRKIFERIFSIDCDDALRYDLDTLRISDITEFKDYHGVRISIFAYLDKTRIPVSIDIGFDDVVYPNRVKMSFPALLDMETPEIYAYSVYSVISEKFEAIVSLGNANSRYKDFYDIFILSGRYDLEGTSLTESIKATFEHRGTSFDDLFALTDRFISSEIHQQRWTAFLKKKHATLNIGLDEVQKQVKAFLLPIVDNIKDGTSFTSIWDHEVKAWKPVLLA